MPLSKVRKKPTIKEMASVIIEINERVNYLSNQLQKLDNVIGYYIEMNDDLENFDKFLSKIRSEYEQKANGKSDKEDIQSDTKDEGSGSKGVRKKK